MSLYDTSIPVYLQMMRNLSAILDKAAADLRGYADQIDEKQMFLRALSSVAKADDKIDPKERRVIGRLWDALGAS